MEEIEDLDVTLNESILESLRGKKLKSTKVRTLPGLSRVYRRVAVSRLFASGCARVMAVDPRWRQESKRKRRATGEEEEEEFDSDDDDFFDRAKGKAKKGKKAGTGTGQGGETDAGKAQAAETAESLWAKREAATAELAELERRLAAEEAAEAEAAARKAAEGAAAATDQQDPVTLDPLDAFMSRVETQIEHDRCTLLRKLVGEKSDAIARFSKLIKVCILYARPDFWPPTRLLHRSTR